LWEGGASSGLGASTRNLAGDGGEIEFCMDVFWLRGDGILIERWSFDVMGGAKATGCLYIVSI
jgi:hypothetical protein